MAAFALLAGACRTTREPPPAPPGRDLGAQLEALTGAPLAELAGGRRRRAAAARYPGLAAAGSTRAAFVASSPRGKEASAAEKLLEAGVRIFEYQPSMMHSKTVVVDDRVVAIGSTNMDPLSFDQLEEGSVVAESPELARHLVRTLRADFELSKEITPEVWAKRDRAVEVLRDTASFFSEWM